MLCCFPGVGLGWVGESEGGGLFSFFTSCFGSHGFVDQGLSVCVLWAWHEDSAGSVGESVEQNLTREHEGSLWRRLDRKRLFLCGGNISFSVCLILCYFLFYLSWVLMHDCRVLKYHSYIVQYIKYRMKLFEIFTLDYYLNKNKRCYHSGCHHDGQKHLVLCALQ